MKMTKGLPPTDDRQQPEANKTKNVPRFDFKIQIHGGGNGGLFK
jgi:hypothetical protein